MKKRADLYFQAAAQSARDWLDLEGHWISKDYPPLGTRERYWLAFALYGVGENGFADAVIRQGRVDANEYPMATTFNIFHTNIATILLLKHRAAMASDIIQRLEGLVRDGFAFLPGNRQPDYQFHGYNDNMPAKATMSLVLGGEMLKEPDVLAHGLWNLRQFRAQLVRCGINSECNSPTYTPLTLHAMAKIAEHALNPEAREIALGIEQRLWIDLASRYHPELGVQAGPYSRAYTADCLTHLSCLSSLLWFELGDSVKPSPMELFNRDSGLVLHHTGDVAFNVAQMCWYPSAYHIPEQARRLFEKKEYPHRAMAAAEWGDFGADFPAKPFRIETFIERDFSVGTMTAAMGGGEQTMSYFVNYALGNKLGSFRERSTIYSKIVINDQEPGQIARDSRCRPDGSSYGSSGEADNLNGRANTVAYQSNATALVLTHPHLSLGGSGDDTTKGAVPIFRLSEMILFPSHFSRAEEVLVNGESRPDWSGEAPRGCWIACRRGKLLVAFRPLVFTRTLGDPRITLEKVNRYEVIRTTFYEGGARIFPRAELKHCFGGFIAEHASVDDYPSLRHFVDDLKDSKIIDHLWTTRRIEYRRPKSARRPALEMEISCSPGTSTPRFVLINGQPTEKHLVKLDGVSDCDLPFVMEPWKPVPAYFPWGKIEVASAAPTISAIGDRDI